VYLIFSVNKSGEFFGYARMDSEIKDAAATEAITAQEPTSEARVSNPPVAPAGPKTIITPRTKTAPRGKIFEDDARGTVFWEVAELSDEEYDGDMDPDQPKGAEKRSNPFRVEWIKWLFL
jgi:hypothetical protein